MSVTYQPFIFVGSKIQYYASIDAEPQILILPMKESLSFIWDAFSNFREFLIPVTGESTPKRIYLDVTGLDFDRMARDNPHAPNLTILSKCAIPKDMLESLMEPKQDIEIDPEYIEIADPVIPVLVGHHVEEIEHVNKQNRETRQIKRDEPDYDVIPHAPLSQRPNEGIVVVLPPADPHVHLTDTAEFKPDGVDDF